MNREQEGLQQLGKKTDYKMTYAPEVLETFEILFFITQQELHNLDHAIPVMFYSA